MIKDINRRQKKAFGITLTGALIVAVLIFVVSLTLGQYGFISPANLARLVINAFGAELDVPKSYGNIIEFIRLPRTIASFIVGATLSVSGLVYQNTFNNKLVSPDILGVSSGSCVGAGLAILLGLSGTMVGISAFLFGALAVMISLGLPKLFRNKSNITLVLSGIITGAFMNSAIGIIKYMADRDDKLSAITFWMMGDVSGITMKEILYILPLAIIPTIVLMLMQHRIDVVSLGLEEAQSLGINYKRNRLIIVICATILTAASVSISGNVGWVGLVIPHITRTLVGNRSKQSLPIALLFGGCFMMVVDLLSRLLSKDDVPLSIITGIFGAVIYAIVLYKKGQTIND